MSPQTPYSGEVSGPPQAPKRGARPTPRNVLASATPYAALAGAPPNYILIPPKLSIWGNDVHGDCVTAEEAFAKACYQPEIFISDQEVISWATQHGVLEGAYLYQVLDWMRNDGFRQDGQIYDDGPRQSSIGHSPQFLTVPFRRVPLKLALPQISYRMFGGKIRDVVAGSQWDSTLTTMRIIAFLSAGMGRLLGWHRNLTLP
jgi:hypothetical protein